MLLIKGGEVHDGINESGAQADVLVEGGKIKRIAKNIRAPKEAVVVNARGLLVYPGFIDAHSHLGMDGYGIGYEGTDYNELNDIISPQ
ncbi:MAG: amidohydrolase, partial [Eubacteriales bacterium]|nr:amidohydrolase [Eubacteriales bacterium]